jgi:hypothetical protein
MPGAFPQGLKPFLEAVCMSELKLRPLKKAGGNGAPSLRRPVRKDGDGFATGRREALSTQPHLRHEATNPLCDARHQGAFAAAGPKCRGGREVLGGIASP